MKPEETVDYHIKTTWHAIARMYNQKAASYDGTMSIGFVLLNIRSDEGTPATKIAPSMGLEARSLTRILKRLEEEKLIYKKPDPIDGRSVRIFLTEEGEEKRKVASDTVKHFNNQIFKSIADKKLKIFFEVMESINQVVEAEAKSGNNNSGK
jgi:DNA-binding MarR family transcriptional regulator